MLNKDYKEMLQILLNNKSQQVVKKINLMQNICVGIAMPDIMPNYESVQTLYTSVVHLHILWWIQKNKFPIVSAADSDIWAATFQAIASISRYVF